MIGYDAQQITPDVLADRDEAGEAIGALLSYLDNGEREQPGQFGMVPQKINEVVGDIMQQVRSRATRNGEERVEPEEVSPVEQAELAQPVS